MQWSGDAGGEKSDPCKLLQIPSLSFQSSSFVPQTRCTHDRPSGRIQHVLAYVEDLDPSDDHRRGVYTLIVRDVMREFECAFEREGAFLSDRDAKHTENSRTRGSAMFDFYFLFFWSWFRVRGSGVAERSWEEGYPP